MGKKPQDPAAPVALDIREVARRARVPDRLVRYVLDHRVLPGGGGRPPGPSGATGRPGRPPRTLTPLEAFFVAAAARLLAAGVRREVVAAALAALAAARWPPPGPPPAPSPRQRAAARPATAAEAAYAWAEEPPAVLWVGDGGAALRLELGPVDTGWAEPRALAPLAPGVEPLAAVRLDLAGLRAALAAPPPAPGGPA